MQVYVRVVRCLGEEGRLFALHNENNGKISFARRRDQTRIYPTSWLVQISTTTIPIAVDLACHRHIRFAQCAPDDPGELSGALYRR